MTATMHPPEPLHGTHTARTADEILQLGQAYAAVPVPTLFDLYRTHDPSGVSGEGRVATGVIFPLDGGAVCRWSCPHPPTGYPRPVHQIAVFDSIAEVLAVHGHQGATLLRTYAATVGPLKHLPEAFAIVDQAGDVPEWGVRFGDGDLGDRAVTWAPPIMPRTGRRQAARHTIWRSMAELYARAGGRGGFNTLHRLNSTAGRQLTRDVRASFAAGLLRHAEAYALAAECSPLSDDVRRSLGMPEQRRASTDPDL